MLKHLYFSLCNFGGTFNMEFTYTGKVSRAIGIIYTISSFCLNNSSLRALYYSPVCPYLFYCVGIWASTYPSSLLQKRVVRIMSRSAFDDHTDPSFKSIGILNLESTVYLQTSSAKIYVSLQIRLTSWLLLNNMFLMTRQVHSYGTRSSELFYLPQFGKLSIRENLVVTSAYSVRPYTLWGWWKGIGCHPAGGGACYKSCDVFVQLAFLLAGDRARKDVAKSSRSNTCLLQKLVYKYFKRKDLCL